MTDLHSTCQRADKATGCCQVSKCGQAHLGAEGFVPWPLCPYGEFCFNRPVWAGGGQGRRDCVRWHPQEIALLVDYLAPEVVETLK